MTKTVVSERFRPKYCPVTREGGYVRYDGRKSTQVLRDCEGLIGDYDGTLSRLHEAAQVTHAICNNACSHFMASGW